METTHAGLKVMIYATAVISYNRDLDQIVSNPRYDKHDDTDSDISMIV